MVDKVKSSRANVVVCLRIDDVVMGSRSADPQMPPGGMGGMPGMM